MARRQSRTEAAISDAVVAFQHDFVGRGPDKARTRTVEDMVIFRSFGVLTPAEKQLAGNPEGRRLIKAMRQQVLEAGRETLEKIVEEHTGAQVVSVHSDISTGYWRRGDGRRAAGARNDLAGPPSLPAVRNTQGRLFGPIGEPGVNVLGLNLALDESD